jgi:hypothetical protein
MTRARAVVAATAVILAATGAFAQTGQSTMPSVLAGKKFTPPLKGQAAVEFTAPKTVKEGNTVVTRITVKNISAAPIARLSIAETWYDKGGAVLTAGRGQINGLLQPGEIQTIVIETPWKLGMTANNYNFAHANGTVKPARVQKLEAPKEPAATPAAATKK